MSRIEGRLWSDYFRWRISQRERPLPKSHGLWCSLCRRSHAYNGKGKLGIKFEQRRDGWYIIWICPISGNHIAELSPIRKQ